MDHQQHMHDMPPPSSSSSSSSNTSHHKMMLMHMTFFWGKNTEVLFSNWPGTSSGMYALCLIFIFFLSFITEYLAYSSSLLLRPSSSDSSSSNSISSSPAVGSLLQTAVYTLRTGLAYLVMLAVMSFNGGVFLVALSGHALGFMMFGTKAYRILNSSTDRKTTPQVPLTACAC